MPQEDEMVDTIRLTRGQEELLLTLVRADRAKPDDARHGFRAPRRSENGQMTLYHLGLPTYGFDVSRRDMYALARAGLVRMLQNATGNVLRIDVTPEGLAFAEERERVSA
jgi:hypothetical protein